MRAYHNCTTATSPRFNLFAGSRGAVRSWTDAEKAAYALTIARSNLEGFQGRYASACASLGQANRMKGPMRRHWVAQAFRAINAARAGIRSARAALVLAMADPALASDQVAA